MTTPKPAPLAEHFTPAQLEALNAWLDEKLRDRLAPLEQEVRELSARLEMIAPKGRVPDEHLAIMAAVFAAHVGKRFRIRAVRPTQETSGWTQAGRVILHAQRHVRRP